MAERDGKKEARLQAKRDRLDGISSQTQSEEPSRAGSPGDAKGEAGGEAVADLARGLGGLGAETLEALEAEVRSPAAIAPI